MQKLFSCLSAFSVLFLVDVLGSGSLCHNLHSLKIFVPVKCVLGLWLNSDIDLHLAHISHWKMIVMILKIIVLLLRLTIA